MTTADALRTLIIGTSGQLATELKRAQTPSLCFVASERVDLSGGGDLLQTLDRLRPALILNAGAYTAVDRAESERERAFELNATGPGLLAEWCERSGAALIHVSTDYVFDGAKAGPYVESDAVAPLNVYGESKLAGERAIRAALRQHLILRTSWVFSAHGQNFVKTMLRLAKERDELKVVADQLGRPTAAKELARAMLLLAAQHARGELEQWGTYHFANTGVTTWHGLAEAVVDAQARLGAKRPVVTPIPSSAYATPARRPANSVLDTDSFQRTFDIKPRPWLDDLNEVVAELAGQRGDPA
jgi:dTDP-4-dehydrorhamnose reductase